ncbi:MAG: M56 family metallopeptidase, partial [Acutalibacteraceae bacterium]
MGELFLKLLNMSITASWLVLAVIAFRFFLKKAPKGLRFFLWGLVALRLVLPFSPESVLSLIPSAETVPDTVSSAGSLTVSSGFEPVDSAVNDYINIHSYAVTASAPDKGISLISVIGIIWAVGVAVMLAYSVFAYLRLKKEVAPSVKIRDNIYVCDGISSPFILGLFKPKIYLSSGLSPSEKELVIAHEQEHLKHRDHFWKPIAFALLSVYWFNPVMWVAFILLCKDIELACDERVIKNMSREEALIYSQTLLNCSSDRKRIIACPVAFGEVSVKERIKTILRYKKPAVVIVAAAVIVSIIVSVCFMTNPKKSESPFDLPNGTFVSEIGTAENYDKEYMYMIIEPDKKSIKFGAKDVLTGDIHDSSVEECSYKIVDGEIQIFNSIGNKMDCKIEKEEKNAIIYNGRRFERSFESLDNAVHDILLPIAKEEYSELKTEGHIIIDTKTSKKNASGERNIEVYLLTRLSNYNFENGCFVEQKAVINGAVIEFKHGEFGYSVRKVDYPEDGEGDFEFVKRCFPEKYRLRVLDVSEKEINEMKKQCVSQAESYLKKIGRKAEIYDGSDFKRITFTDVGVSDEVCEKIRWFSGYDYIGNI